jgi:ketosteroid isomerase-like protein
MRKLLTIALLLLATLPALAQAKPEAELKPLLNDFLAAASHTPASAADKQMFNRFFADDILYTRSAGVLITKQDIMKSLDEPADPKEPTATYTAADVTIHAYGNLAILAFKLVQKTSDGATTEYRNTGTFQRRKGQWQAIAWQATKIPPKEPKTEKHSYVPPKGFVPDSDTAIRLALAVWTPIYGEKQLTSEKPFRAQLRGDTWFVNGSLPKGWDGGVVEAEIDKRDGKILRVSHAK